MLKKLFAAMTACGLIIALAMFLHAVPAAAGAERITIGGGSPGALFYRYAAAMARLLNQTYPGVLMANSASTGGSAQNAMLLGKKEQEFGVVATDVLEHAYNGTYEFTNKKYSNLRSVSGGYSYAMNLIVPYDSPIKSYAQVKGKKMCVGPAGGSYHTHVQRIMLAGYGIDINKDCTLVHMNYSQAPQALKDGTVDAIWNPSGIIQATRSGGTYNLAVTKKVRFVSIDKEAIPKVMATFNYFSVADIKPGFFPNQDDVYRCLTVMSTVATHKDVSTDLVYKYTSAMFNKKAELIEMFPAGQGFADFARIKRLPIPLHPGAIKFYKEKGVQLPKFN